MIGIIIGIITGLNYLGAAWVDDALYWSGTGGSMLILTLLGVFLFPKTIARILSVTLWFAPVAIIVSFFNGGAFPMNIIAPIVYGIAASIALAVVKLFRMRAREVNL